MLEDPYVQSQKRALENFLQLPLLERLQTDPPKLVDVPARVTKELLNSLKERSWHKCAFCERLNQNLLIYRFRPDGSVKPLKQDEDRHHYVWLRWDWDNLFPICRQCIPENPYEFPVLGKRSNFYRSLSNDSEILFEGHSKKVAENAGIFCPGTLSQGIRRFQFGSLWDLEGLSKKATATLLHFNLHRPDLVSHRKRKLSLYLSSLMESRNNSDFDEDLLNFEAMEYGGSWFLLLRKLVFEFNLHSATKQNFPRKHAGLILRRALQNKEFLRLVKGATQNLLEIDDIVPLHGEDNQSEGDEVGAYRYPNLKTITIKNFRSLESIEISISSEETTVDSNEKINAPCLLLLGENSTGKSSVLEAVALAGMGPYQRGEFNLNSQDRILNADYLGSPSIESPKKATVQLSFFDRELNKSTELCMVIPSSEDVTISNLDLPLLFAYGPHRVFGEHEMEPSVAGTKVLTLFNNDEKLPNPEKWLANLVTSHRESDLNEVVAALRSIIQIDGHFSHIDVSEGRCFIHVKKYASSGEYEVSTPLDRMSSGYSSILAIVCDIFEGLMGGKRSAAEARRSSALVLIDEIEAHLHPRWKLQLVAGLRQAFPSVTFIMTTHDPLCVRGMLPEEVTVLSRYPTDWQSDLMSLYNEIVTASSALLDPRNLTIEQLLASDLFGMYTTADMITEVELAAAADLLVAHKGQVPADLSEDEQNGVKFISREIAASFPLGGGEIQQIIQFAVSQYLQQRRKTPLDKRSDLRLAAQKRIAQLIGLGAGSQFEKG